jgi:hypothetical protein
MNNRILTISILLIAQTSFSQKLTVEAVYCDNHEVPYKIERKYSDNNLITYVTHFNQGSVCVKRQTSFRGDTTIIKEESYRIFNEKTKLELFQDCESWSVSLNTTGDTVWLKGYKIEYSPDTVILVGDTMLTGESTKNSWSFSERIKKERVPLILSGKMTVNLDSLILNETNVVYYLNGIPVKVDFFDANNNKHRTTSVFLKNRIIYKSDFTDNGVKADTISWNKDTTETKWGSAKIQINGTVSNVSFDDSTKKKVEYLESGNIFNNIIIGNLIYSDVLYFMELRYFDREKIVSVTTNGKVENNKYTFDNKNRIIEQVSYDNGQLQKRVTYKYGN